MPRQPIHSDRAPAAIGPYSQAVRTQAARAGDTVYLSGQIPLDPASGTLVEGDIATQARRAFDNLTAVCEAAGGSLDDVVRVGLYLIDLGQFAEVNAVMAEYFESPYPARSTVEVSALPKGATFEVDAVMVLG
jgi:reactive intermediate/imine deaminase